MKNTNFRIIRKRTPFLYGKRVLIIIMRTFPAFYEKYRVSRKKAVNDMVKDIKIQKKYLSGVISYVVGQAIARILIDEIFK